jgi:uncharacterized protein (DUF1778 family)
MARRRTFRERKDVQLNLKITPSHKRRLDMLADVMGLTLTGLLEVATAEIEKKLIDQRKRAPVVQPSLFIPPRRDWLKLDERMYGQRP